MCGEWAGFETEARSSGTGLWADKDSPPPPWQWRRDKKGSSTLWVEKFYGKRFGVVLKAIALGNAIGVCLQMIPPGTFAWREKIRL